MKKVISWILVILWMILIFVLSHQDASASTSSSDQMVDVIRTLIINFRADKWLENLIIDHVRELAHFGVYLVLGVLLINATNVKHFITALVIGIIYAISDEIHQVFVPGRAFQVFDILIDVIGLSVGLLVFSVIIRKEKTDNV